VEAVAQCWAGTWHAFASEGITQIDSVAMMQQDLDLDSAVAVAADKGSKSHGSAAVAAVDAAVAVAVVARYVVDKGWESRENAVALVAGVAGSESQSVDQSSRNPGNCVVVAAAAAAAAAGRKSSGSAVVHAFGAESWAVEQSSRNPGHAIFQTGLPASLSVRYVAKPASPAGSEVPVPYPAPDR
jgi:hypothetical protein